MADGSTTESIGKTLKDKECLFCHQAFTSSSLGRHLDLYIKEKNPKPPDDVHDIDEIRKLRGSITRRQPHNYGHRDTSTVPRSKATPLREGRPPISMNHIGEGLGDNAEPFKNQANWQATRGNNDLAPMPRNKPVSCGTRRAASSKGRVKEYVTHRKENLDALDQGRAAELALEEVLESVKAAHERAHPPTPFEFNFFGLTLPQMYLQCLSSPPTLLAGPAQRPHELSWSVHSPSSTQCEILRGWLAEKLYGSRRGRDSAQYGNTWPQSGLNGTGSPKAEAESMGQEESPYYDHLQYAFAKWAKMTDAERQAEWHLECAKAYAREREKHHRTRQKLDSAEQVIRQLRGRLDQVALHPHLQQYPLISLPLSREAVSHLPVPKDLDHSTLISKWRSRLQSSRSTQQPLASRNWNSSLHSRPKEQDPSSSMSQHRHSWTRHNGVPATSAMPEEDGGELDDAPGEEDVDQTQQYSQQPSQETRIDQHSVQTSNRRHNDASQGARDPG